MKVIIIKDCKDGKVNEVIDVSSGYATNYLIKNKFALPFNSKTEHILKSKKDAIKKDDNMRIQNALILKKKIEGLNLKFFLKTKQMVVHGSVTKKQINKELLNNGIKLNSYNIENVKINSLGNSIIKIKLYKNTVAKLKIEVVNEK